MDKKPNWWQRRKIGMSLGVPTAIWEDLGKVDHTVIRFKGYYISVMEKEDGTLSLGWSEDPHMFPDVNINDFWQATPPVIDLVTLHPDTTVEQVKSAVNSGLTRGEQ